MTNGQTDKVTATVPVGKLPQGVAVDPQTNRVYAAVQGSSSVAVLAGAGGSARPSSCALRTW